MADDEALTITIEGNSTSAVESAQTASGSLDTLNASVTGLAASMERQAGASDALTAAIGKLSEGHRVLQVETEKTTGLSDAFTSHSLLMSRGFQALGIDAGEAATRVGALGDMMGRFAAVNPAILAVVGSLTALFGAIEFFKTGVHDAEEFQSAMTTMGQAVAAQGGNWTALSAEIEKFIASESLASGFTRDQLAESLNTLVTSLTGLEGANAAVSDSEKILAVSEETAVAKHRELADVVHMLMQAEVGRGVSLAQLDPRLKEVIHTHQEFDTALRILHEDNAKQLDDMTSAERAQDRLKASYAGVGEEIGSRLLPIITELSSVLIGSIPAIGDLARAFADGLGGALGIVGHSAAAAYHAVLAVATAGVGDLKDAKDEFGAFVDQGKDLGKSLYNSTLGWMGDIGKAAGDFASSYTRAEDEITAAIKRHIAAVQDLHTQFNPPLGNLPSGGGGSGFNAPASAYEQPTERTELQNAANKDLTATTNALAAAKQHALETETQLAIAVKLSTTAAAEQSATQALDTAKMSDAEHQIAMLSAALVEEKAKQTELTGTMNSAHAQWLSLNATLQEHQRELEGTKKMQSDTKQSMSELEGQVSDAKSRYDDAKAALAQYNTAVKDHQQQLADLTKTYEEARSALDESLASIERDWDSFTRKQAQDASDNAAKQTLSGQSLLDHYRQQYEADYALYQYYLNQKEDYLASVYETAAKDEYSKMVQEQNTLYQQDYNNYKSVLDRMTTIVTGFVDTILTKHKSLRDEMKSVEDQMLQDWINMLNRMIASTINSGLVSWLGKLFGLGGGGATGSGGIGSLASGIGVSAYGTPGAAATGGAFGATAGAGSTGASAISAALPSLGNSAALSALGASGFGGVGGGGIAGTFDTLGVSGGISGAESAAAGGATSVAPASILPSGGAGIGGLGVGLGALFVAGLGGDVVGNMLNPHNMGSEVGGALGGIGGLLGILLGLGVPTGGLAIGITAVAALLGAVFGAKLGGLFGDHFNPADEPDIYQTQLWGQELADLQGSTSGNPMNANGQQFVMDSWTRSNTSGKGWNLLFEQFVQMFRNNQKVLPGALQGGFGDIEKLWGGAQNQADFNDNGKNGVLQIGSGSQAPWTQFWGYVSAYGPAIAQLMSQFTPTDLYAASLNGSVSQLGGYTPGGNPWLIHSFPDAGLAPGTGGAPPSVMGTQGGSKQTLININVPVSMGGSIIADRSLNRRILQALLEVPGFSAADIGSAIS